MTDTLKPCPFCGGRAEIHSTHTGELIFCDECKVETPLYTKGCALSMWNRRIVDSDTNILTEALRHSEESKTALLESIANMSNSLSGEFYRLEESMHSLQKEIKNKHRSILKSQTKEASQQKSVCSEDGCYRTEDCGPFCRNKN